MSTYGPPDPADPWNDATEPQDVPPTTPAEQPPAQPVAPPPPIQPVLPPAQPSAPQSPPAAYSPPTFQPPPNYQGGYAQPQAPYQAPYGPPPYGPQYQQPQPRQGSSALVIVLVVLLVVVVLTGAGIGIFLWRTNGATQTPPAVPTVNECLASDGNASNPQLSPAQCGPDTYKVLKVQRGSVDTGVCNNVEGVTNNYVFQWPVDPGINDYVLCLQKQ